MLNDTICAVSTAKGSGALAIVRLSGEDALKIALSFFSNQRLTKPHTAVHGKFVSAGEVLDEVIGVYYKSPRSFSGEDMVEFTCHGNPFIVGRILEALLTMARAAEPGEFTKRAFLNNKLDLTEAEAIGDLLFAQTISSHKLAMAQLSGKLYKKIALLLEELTDLRLGVELEIDFVDQGLTESEPAAFCPKISGLITKIELLLANAENGMMVRDGLKVAVVGAPNVGKSSIFNAFLESERAIVTPIAGTTRDFLEEAFSLHGYLLRLFDTAGLRQTDDTIEKIGISRTLELVDSCDLVIFVSDLSDNRQELETVLKRKGKEKVIKVLNKVDLYKPGEIASFLQAGYLCCSTKRSDGLSPLKTALEERFKNKEAVFNEGTLTNIRQKNAARNALISLQKAYAVTKNFQGWEFIAFDLKEASHFLEEIIGKISSEELLNRIFSNYCIGK